MRLFNNYYVRYFAGGFLIGVSVVLAASKTDSIKNLKIESVSGRAIFTGTSAWVIVGTIFGLFGGILGLGTGGIKKRIKRA